MCICYEVEFPELVRDLRKRQAQVLFVPTAVAAPLEKLKPLTDALIPCRALENNLYVFYCNRVGFETSLTFLGRSTAAGPHGTVLAQLGDQVESVAAIECSLATVHEARREHPFLDDLRPQMFK